jgi:hypothetical protein
MQHNRKIIAKGGWDMISVNKTDKLWNNDKEFKTMRYEESPMCCWFWCWIYMWW